MAQSNSTTQIFQATNMGGAQGSQFINNTKSDSISIPFLQERSTDEDILVPKLKRNDDIWTFQGDVGGYTLGDNDGSGGSGSGSIDGGGTGIANRVMMWQDPNTATNGSWLFSGNTLAPFVDGSNIGIAGTNRVGTLFTTGGIDYATNLIISEAGVERARFIPGGNLGLGVAAPTATLQVNGTIRYVDGNQALGFVLTSDASGNATWQAAGGPSGGLIIQSDIDVATPQLYPAATAGQAFRIVNSNGALVTGLIGGAAGIQVERFDIILALADNPGGTQAAVGTFWTIWEGERSQLWVHGDPSVQGAILQNNLVLPNTSVAEYTVVMGSDNDILDASSFNTLVTGSGNTINGGSDAMIIGGTVINVTDGSGGIVVGSQITTNNAQGAAVFGQGITVTNSNNVLVSGQGNTLTDSNAAVIAGTSGITTTSVESVSVGNTLSITNSAGAVAFGFGNTITGSARSFVIGSNSEVTTAIEAHAFGTSARADQARKHVHALGPMTGMAAGSAQGEHLPGFIRTTGAVNGVLLNYFVPNNSSLQISGNINVSRHIAGAGAIGDTSGVLFDALVKNVAGVVTIVNSNGTVLLGEIVGATVGFSVVGTNFRITANGIATDTLNWSVYAKSSRVGFGAYA